jgi:predicted dithiol-disulfide oxidoreductase (DUF899 family)
MALPDIATREEWLVARKALLAREKEHTRQKDVLNADRRRLPMVRIDKDYTFEGPDGPVNLIGLFEGRRQLVLQHFMFDPDWEEGCPSCTASCDDISDGLLTHLHSRETTFAVVARAPLTKIEKYKSLRGWTFPWYSSFGSDFNYDFHATIDESVAPIEFNYRSRAEMEDPENVKLNWITTADQPFESPGLSFFLRDGESIFHTYSLYGRGTEDLGGAYAFLDMTALGRQEEWEEPKGRAVNPYDASPDFSD